MPTYIVTAAVRFEIQAEDDDAAQAILNEKAKELVTMSATDAGAYEVTGEGPETGIQQEY